MREERKNRKGKERKKGKKNPKPYHLPPRRRTQLRGLGKRFSFDVGPSTRRAFRPFSTPVFYGLGSMALRGGGAGWGGRNIQRFLVHVS